MNLFTLIMALIIGLAAAYIVLKYPLGGAIAPSPASRAEALPGPGPTPAVAGAAGEEQLGHAYRCGRIEGEELAQETILETEPDTELPECRYFRLAAVNGETNQPGHIPWWPFAMTFIIGLAVGYIGAKYRGSLGQQESKVLTPVRRSV